jgi:hypothetical protein
MNSKISSPRKLQRIISGRDTQDGAGVSLTRLLPAPGLSQLDPFLLLDRFSSDNPDDYIAGFPPHPHRGFETVTYLFAGRMRHRDSAGHAGIVKAGGVQWMSAASGIEHSEMPEQQDGLLAGFQLWVNLPAAHKMDPPRYQELEPEQVPEERHDNGVMVRVIAGHTRRGSVGAVTGVAVQPLYLDVSLPAGAEYSEQLADGHNGFIYVESGEIVLSSADGGDQALQAGELGVLGEGDGITLRASPASRLLVIAGRPIGEPVARHGPFVMNTSDEIAQAYRDYRQGQFGHVASDTPTGTVSQGMSVERVQR